MISPDWDRAVPDIPRWVETRSMLLQEAVTVGTPEGGLVLGRGLDLAGVVGAPDDEILGKAMAMLQPDAELLVPPESIDHVMRSIPHARAELAVIHDAPPLLPMPDDHAVEVRPVDEKDLGWLSCDLAPEAEGARWAAVKPVNGEVVAMCTAGPITETLWDVGIDTVEGHRRQGYARSCFLTLAEHLSPLSPVWGALDDNQASLAMAASLGFSPIDELWVVTVP